jgi:hypothetical protein
MAILTPVLRQRFFSASGIPLSGGKIYTYVAGTTTPLATYTDATETSANTNPIILDANGECNLWLGSGSYKIKLTNSADVEQWTVDFVNQSSIQSLASSDYIENLGITCSTSSNALTINVKTASGGVPGVGSPVRVGFRSSSLASGLVSLVEIQSPLAMTISSGSTLGHTSGVDLFVYVYLINYNGVAELAVSGTFYTEASLVSTTAEGGAGAADSGSTIYSTTARTNVPIRLIGRLTSNQATAGLWATMPSEIQTGSSAGSSSVGTSQIANLAVTTAKIADGAVTNAKLASANYLESSSSTVSVTGTSFTDIASISSFTTVGRLCQFGVFTTSSASNTSFIQISSAFAASAEGLYQIWDDTNSVEIGGGSFVVNGSGLIVYYTIPTFFIVLSAGTRNLKLRAALATSGSSRAFNFTAVKFYALEN